VLEREKVVKENQYWTKLFHLVKAKKVETSCQQAKTSGTMVEQSDWMKILNPADYEVGHLNQEEEGFWQHVLSGEEGHGGNFPEYLKSSLKPIKEDDAKKKAKYKALQALRTEVFLIFLFLNASWSLGIFWLQEAFESEGVFGLDWKFCPLSIPINKTIHRLNTTDILTPTESYYQLDPINFVFILLFIIVLVIQMIGMLLHRAETLSHWMAANHIQNNSKNRKKNDGRQPESKRNFQRSDGSNAGYAEIIETRHHQAASESSWGSTNVVFNQTGFADDSSKSDVIIEAQATNSDRSSVNLHIDDYPAECIEQHDDSTSLVYDTPAIDAENAVPGNAPAERYAEPGKVWRGSGEMGSPSDHRESITLRLSGMRVSDV